MPLKTRTLTTAAAIAAAAVVIFFVCSHYYSHDPAEGGAPQCLFKLLTGFDCPGCGSQRALHAMLHGDVARAWSFNPLVFFLVPLAVFYIVAESMRRSRPRLYAAAVSPAALSALLIIVIVYTVVRNL